MKTGSALRGDLRRATGPMRSPVRTSSPPEADDDLPAAQRAIRSRCFHPSGSWAYMEPDAGERTVHELIEAQAAATPDRIAVVSPKRTLSYAGLNREANRLARRIISHSEAGDVPIAVCCSFGASQVIALLAILKAKRFFVSVPASDPPERNRRLVAATGARMVIADRANLETAIKLLGDRRAVLNADSAVEDDYGLDLGLSVSADALIRITMTSGSTGEPRGIMQTHRTVLFGAVVRNNAVHLCPEDGLLVATAAFTELWRPLLVGATLYVFDLKADDMNCLRDWLATERVTAFRATPSVLRRLVTALAADAGADAGGAPLLFPSLRVVELMGEPVPVECVRLYQRHFPQSCVLINFLGAKEVLDYRILYMDHETRIAGDWVVSGYALPGTRASVLDEAGRPVRPGAIGEIAVRSPSMSLGYWRDDELTSERFVVDSSADGRRIFRTGDLGQFLADDCLIYAGRRDSMVKVRGQRVDLDSLEAALRALDAVGDAAVVPQSTDGDTRLVAFVVARPGHEPGEKVLRRELAARLPDYMIPSAFVFLEAMPTTPMGKIDRDALRTLAGRSLPPQSSVSLSSSPGIESGIAAIWGEFLGRSEIALDENVFELGGNSMMVMQVALAMQRRFEIELPLAVLFDRPTVRTLAAYVRAASPVTQPVTSSRS